MTPASVRVNLSADLAGAGEQRSLVLWRMCADANEYALFAADFGCRLIALGEGLVDGGAALAVPLDSSAPAEKDLHVPSSAEVATEAETPVAAPPKAVAKPAAEPTATAKAVPTGAACEECGKPLEAAEEKTSRLFVSRPVCKKCLGNL